MLSFELKYVQTKNQKKTWTKMNIKSRTIFGGDVQISLELYRSFVLNGNDNRPKNGDNQLRTCRCVNK